MTTRKNLTDLFLNSSKMDRVDHSNWDLKASRLPIQIEFSGSLAARLVVMEYLEDEKNYDELMRRITETTNGFIEESGVLGRKKIKITVKELKIRLNALLQASQDFIERIKKSAEETKEQNEWLENAVKRVDSKNPDASE